LNEHVLRVYEFSENFYTVLIRWEIKHETDEEKIVGAIYLLQRNHNIFNFFGLHRGDIVGKVIEVIDRAVLGIQPYLNE
jgi:hypothetical protein